MSFEIGEDVGAVVVGKSETYAIALRTCPSLAQAKVWEPKMGSCLAQHIRQLDVPGLRPYIPLSPDKPSSLR